MLFYFMRSVLGGNATAEDESHQRIQPYKDPVLFLIFLAIAFGLTIVSGLMSGLTLGLMSLDSVDLELLKRSGTPQEQRHAERIMPVIK